MISFEVTGDFKNTESFLKAMSQKKMFDTLEKYGQMGVDALSNATPVASGLAARSWSYSIEKERDSYTITWSNGDIENGFPVVIMLQYGHATRNGGFIRGIDYINPALKPIFDKIDQEVWKAVTSA